MIEIEVDVMAGLTIMICSPYTELEFILLSGVRLSIYMYRVGVYPVVRS